MTTTRPFRFGIQLTGPLPGLSWTDTARAVEAAGYSSLHLPDHFGDQFGPLPAMAAAAAVTSELVVGTLVFDNDYRHPLVLAKDLATLDVIAEGRVEFGIGSGWMRTDYEASGIAYDDPKLRVDRFVEGVEIIEKIFSGERFSYDGDYYSITDYEGFPKPHTPGGPKLLIGGGRPRMLRFAAQHADIVGINPTIASGQVDADAARDAGADRFDAKVKLVREAAGDRLDDIELNALVMVCAVTDDPMAMAEMVAPMFGVEPSLVLESPATAIGTVDGLCDEFERRRDRWGLNYSIVQQDAFEQFAPIVARLAGT